jgi:hypothetical protein
MYRGDEEDPWARARRLEVGPLQCQCYVCYGRRYVKEFTSTIVGLYEGEYLRPPNKAEVQQILRDARKY